MDDNIIYYKKRNRKKLLNRGDEYYRNNKDRIRDQARHKYRELFEEEKNIKMKYGRNRYYNMSKKKKRLKKYQKNIVMQKKSK